MAALDPLHLEYGMEVDEKIKEGLITPRQYKILTKQIGIKQADDLVKTLTEPFVPLDLPFEPRNPKINVLESARDYFGVGIVDTVFSLLQTTLLKSKEHDDFPWDSIICVSGHSDISDFEVKSYSDLGDLSVVTIFASDIGTTCISSKVRLEQLSDFIYELNKVHRLTPTGVAITLNTVLRELPKNLQAEFPGAKDVLPFLESGAKLSPSTTEYYDKEWEFFEMKKSGCKPYGFVHMYVGDDLYDLIGPSEPCELILNKSEILRRALRFGNRPLFVDLGCADCVSKKAKTSGKEKPLKGGKRKTKRKKI